MPTPRRTPAQRNAPAIRFLKKADPVLGEWISRVGPCDLAPDRRGTHFDALVRSIVYQQLSGKAAATIHGRYLALYGDRPHEADALLALSDDQLRGAGLSRGKMASIRDLATRITTGKLPLHELDAMGDEEAITYLSSVRGIGRWTAQMVLMFRLGRPDVVPELDLGVQKGIQLIYGLRTLPKPDRVLKISARWAPHRTIASWYCWRVLELD